MNNEKKLINNVNEILLEEGFAFESEDHEKNLEYILKALESSKDILSPLYSFKSRERGGFLGTIKTKIQNKIIFTVINVIEKQSQKQQKFNELVYRYIQESHKIKSSKKGN